MTLRMPYELKGFTIAELLVVLALTSITVTLSYSTLNYIQKLFGEFKRQNRFMNELTGLKERLDRETLLAKQVTEEKDNYFEFRRDSAVASLQILEQVILLKYKEHCDTFHIKAKKIEKSYEAMRNPAWVNKLLNKLEFETEFTKQTFRLCFYKEHSAALKLKLEQEE